MKFVWKRKEKQVRHTMKLGGSSEIVWKRKEKQVGHTMKLGGSSEICMEKE